MIKENDIQPYLFEDKGFPRLKWMEAEEWIYETFSDEEQETAFNAMLKIWMEMLSSKLNEEYRIFESEHFLLYTVKDEGLAQSILDVCEQHFKLIKGRLSYIIEEEYSNKFPLVIFRDKKNYDKYVSYYYPEGDLSESDGIALVEDIIHIAAPLSETEDLDYVLLIELIYGYLANIPIPEWIVEGIVVTIERLDENIPRPVIEDEDLDMLKQHWENADIQDFWLGKSFYIPELDKFSFRLAELILDILFEEHKEDVIDFIINANYKDAGFQSADNYLEVNLSTIVERVLGKGDWGAKPDTWDIDENDHE